MEKLEAIRQMLYSLNFKETPNTGDILYFTNSDKDNIQLKYSKISGKITILSKYGKVLKEYNNFEDFRDNYLN